jgi:hypothetical protein
MSVPRLTQGLRVAGVFAACSTAMIAPAAAQGPDPNSPYVQSITYGGTGCPQASVGQSLSSDRTVFTLIFDQFVASAGPGVPIGESLKNCQVNVALHVPPGAGDVCLVQDARGFVQLPAGVGALETTLAHAPTNEDPPPPGAIVSNVSFAGPVSRDYLRRGGLIVHYDGAAPATKPAVLSAQVRVDASGGQAQITMDSFDGRILSGGCADSTLPSIAVTSSVPANANGWNNTDVGVSFACTAPSGVDGSASSLTPVTLASTGTAIGTCVDTLGQTVSAFYSAYIDKVPPTIGVTSPVPGGLYGLGASVASSFSCGDDNSGVSSCAGASALTTSSIGGKTLVVTATDLAGNTASVSVPYSIGGKDQCKGGGSDLFIFPKFKNQGACVSTYAPGK